MGKDMDTQVQEIFRTPNRHDQKNFSISHYSQDAKTREVRKDIESQKRKMATYLQN